MSGGEERLGLGIFYCWAKFSIWVSTRVIILECECLFTIAMGLIGCQLGFLKEQR
jgi:hypothetical protein